MQWRNRLYVGLETTSLVEQLSSSVKCAQLIIRGQNIPMCTKAFPSLTILVHFNTMYVSMFIYVDELAHLAFSLTETSHEKLQKKHQLPHVKSNNL